MAIEGATGMKVLLDRAAGVLRPLGYRRAKASFCKVDNGFYKLVHFQRGAYGNYFFVNLGVHPVGFPSLIAGRLEIRDQPAEYQCALRCRIEEAITCESVSIFRHGFVSYNDPASVAQIVAILPNEVESWLMRWGSFRKILDTPDADINRMSTVVPALWEKGRAMLRYFCCVKLGDILGSRQFLDQYLASDSAGYDFLLVDDYLRSLTRQS